MAYNKTTWVSGETPLSAQNFNNMEEGISASYSGENELTFTSGDTETEPSKSASVELLESGETLKSILTKMSNMFKNVRYLLKMMGTTDISGLSSEKTVTGALAQLNGKTAVFVKKMTTGATFGDVTVYLPKDVTNAVVIPTVINNHYVVCLNSIARAGAGSNISLIIRNISAGDAVINEEVDIRVVAIFP